MHKRLSEESEKRILNALEKVAALMNLGEHPNDAISKVASEMRIPAGHVQLMVNAVNTGRTNAHRLAYDDPFEKASEFPLADASVVLERLYPNKVRTKAAIHLDTIVADEYRRSPKWLHEKAAREKAARAVDWKLTNEKPAVERDPDYAIKKAMGQVQKMHQQLEAQRMELTRQRDEALKVASALREYFMRPGHIAFNEVAENCELLLGKSAAVVLKIAKPAKEAYAKRDPTPVSMELEPYKLVKKAMQLAVQFKESQEAYQAAAKKANYESRKLLRPFGPGLAQGRSVMEDLSWQPGTKVASIGKLIASGFGLMPAGDIAGEIAKKLPINQLTKDLEKKDLQELTDPAHEAEIRNIQAEALLNDLLANDEVIKGYDPQEVIDAFNEVQQIAPHAYNKKAIMRDLLRKRLAGGGAALDQFTISDLLGQQEKLRNMSTPGTSQLNVLKDIGALPGVSTTHGSVLDRK